MKYQDIGLSEISQAQNSKDLEAPPTREAPGVRGSTEMGGSEAGARLGGTRGQCGVGQSFSVGRGELWGGHGAAPCEGASRPWTVRVSVPAKMVNFMLCVFTIKKFRKKEQKLHSVNPSE